MDIKTREKNNVWGKMEKVLQTKILKKMSSRGGALFFFEKNVNKRRKNVF